MLIFKYTAILKEKGVLTIFFQSFSIKNNHEKTNNVIIICQK